MAYVAICSWLEKVKAIKCLSAAQPQNAASMSSLNEPKAIAPLGVERMAWLPVMPVVVVIYAQHSSCKHGTYIEPSAWHDLWR